MTSHKPCNFIFLFIPFENKTDRVKLRKQAVNSINNQMQKDMHVT